MNNTTRDWQQYPRNIPLDTAIGTVYLAVTNDDHIHVSTQGDGVVVNRVAYYVSLHLHRQPDNTWAGDRIHMTRADWRKDPSRAARMKAQVVISGAVTEWAYDNPDVFVAAAQADTNNRIIDVEGEIEDLESQLAELRTKRDGLLAAERGHNAR